jgi:hypothetical protein
MVEIGDLIIGLFLTALAASFVLYLWDTGADLYYPDMKNLASAFVLLSVLTRFGFMRRTP